MTRKEWEQCNTCWTCTYRSIINGKICCWYNDRPKVLANKDIINSTGCEYREKEEWREWYER